LSQQKSSRTLPSPHLDHPAIAYLLNKLPQYAGNFKYLDLIHIKSYSFYKSLTKDIDKHN